jgi:hypothetical protein
MLTIDLGQPSADAVTELLELPGAFLWWYADLATEDGAALVLIWSLGLPFLPGSRAGSAPMARPALSLGVYRDGRPDFYLLQDYARGPRAMLDASGSGSLGGTTFAVAEAHGTLTLTATLDEPIPASRERVSGQIKWVGSSARVPVGRAESVHHWSPRSCSATGSASLLVGQRCIELRGSGYFDANFSRAPLVAQGIRQWLWGRVAFARRTVVFYQTCFDGGEVQTWLLEQPRGAGLRPLAGTLRWGASQRSLYGVRAPRALHLDTEAGSFAVALSAPVDDGPFYQRFLATTRAPCGEAGRGLAELVVPNNIDQRWQRPFIRMRTHCVGGHNSAWLPLFSGSRAGRISRLLRGSFGA